MVKASSDKGGDGYPGLPCPSQIRTAQEYDYVLLYSIHIVHRFECRAITPLNGKGRAIVSSNIALFSFTETGAVFLVF